MADKAVERMVQIITGLTKTEVGHYNNLLYSIDLRIADNRPIPEEAANNDNFVPIMTEAANKLLELLMARRLGREQAVALSTALKPHSMHLERAEHKTEWHTI